MNRKNGWNSLQLIHFLLKVAFLYNIYIYYNILSSTMESKGIQDESVEENTVSIGERMMTEKFMCHPTKHLSFNNVRLKNPDDELRIFKSNIAGKCLKIYSKKHDRTETKI